VHWLTWSWIPGVHWLAWLHAGRLTSEPLYYVFGFIYALPMLLLLLNRPLSIRALLVSWGICWVHLLLRQSVINRRIAQSQGKSGSAQELMQALLRAALAHGGCITVTQGVMETGATFAEVEQALQAMVASGYVYMRDHVETGVTEYVFTELE
jgi:hypothetical protein